MQDRLSALLDVTRQQLDLLRLFLYVSSQGPTEYEGNQLAFSLSESKRRTVAITAMAAGQSVNTLMGMSEQRGIPVRDMYPIARSAIESFVNAAFLAAEDDAVSKRALAYVHYAAWKYSNRTVGSGEFSLHLSSSPDPVATASAGFPEFAGKGQGSWTSLDVPSRIRTVGERASRAAGNRLLAAYALIYSLSSEIIHGSVYGVSHFFQVKSSAGTDVAAFQLATKNQIEDIFIAVQHALAGFLSAVFTLQGQHNLVKAEVELFARLLRLSIADTAATSGSPP
jgi:hypothetical protein